ncbi:MAG TPA: AAA family ATPase [Gemmatimonadaceae bacterium]|nr:AAA family ATPase [Gemmatimonadaceae bacterium]
MPRPSASTGNTRSGGRPLGKGPFLRTVERRAGNGEERFPFTVPAIRTLEALKLAGPVTFFVGENGSGKSTLLEGIAAAARLPAVGSDDVQSDGTLAAQRALGDALRLVWSRRTTRGFFLRAEDFFGFTKRLAVMRAELTARLVEIEAEYADRSDYAKGLAMGPVRSSLGALEERYGVDLDANSHGQSFLRLFRSRFVPGGLYLLDEPEAPLSPQSQLGLMAMMSDMVAEDAQFIIATHSPILLAYPGATIVSFDEVPVRAVEYGELEGVRLVREFLVAPERYLRGIVNGQ